MIIEIIICLVLLIAACFYRCAFAEEKKLTALAREDLALTQTRKVVFLAVGAVMYGALIWCLAVHNEGTSLPTLLRPLCLAAVLLCAAETDLLRMIIPDKLLLAGLIVRVLLYGAEWAITPALAWSLGKDALLGGGIIGLFFLLLALVFKGSMGMGDVKLLALIGLYLGLWGTMSAVFLSLLASFVVSIVLLVTKKKGRKDSIPFGPCIMLGTVLSICFNGI